MRHDDEALAICMTGRQKPLFFPRMIWIANGESEWITKHRRGLVERNSMVGLVLLILLRVPFEIHPHEVYAGTPSRCFGGLTL